MYFLRFTSDPNRDIQYGSSLWVDWTQSDRDEHPDPKDDQWIWVEDFACWCRKHSGLSGHALSLDHDAIEDAIEEVMNGHWFANPHKDSWAIFEGQYSNEQDTPEGDTFNAESILHFCEATGNNASL